MKKLSKLKLAQSVEIMNDDEMKFIVGGYGEGGRVVGLQCGSGVGCRIDIDYGSHIECGVPASMSYCRSQGLNC